MICNHCGTYMAEGTRFCPSCGTKAPAPVKSNSGENRIIKEVGIPKFRFYFELLGSVLVFILFICILSYYLTEKAEIDSHLFASSSQRNALTMVGVWTVALLIIAAIQIVRTYTFYKMSLCICEHTIYGNGSKLSFILPESFKFPCTDIISVRTGRFHSIVIETRAKNYACIVSDRDEVCRLIQERIGSVNNHE